VKLELFLTVKTLTGMLLRAECFFAGAHEAAFVRRMFYS